MIEIKLGEILNAQNVLNKISNANFPIVYAYKISKLLSLLEIEIKSYYQAQNILLEKYGQHDANNQLIVEKGNVAIIPEKIPDFNEELKELMNVDIQIASDPIPLSQINGMNMTPRELLSISKFIEE